MVEYPQVDRRSQLSLREFRREYLNTQRPVVITDAIEDWPARTAWTFESLKQRFGDTRVTVHRYDAEAEFRPDDVKEVTLSEYIDGVSQGDLASYPYYLRDNWRLFHTHPELLAEHAVPGYFSDWFRFFPRALRLPYPRIFIGPKGAITPLHVDIWNTHAWLSQLVGRKRWILFAPDQASNLYDYTVRVENPDLQRHPLFERASGLECTIGPGDTVFVPSRWSHWVESLDPTISLTYNYMGPGCLLSVLQNVGRDVGARLSARMGLRAQPSA